MQYRAVTSLAAVVATVGLATGTAPAGVTINYTSDLVFTYDVSYMPDFDQRRDDLPGNGSMYCVPTASLDVCAFLARHGYPTVFPGSESYWYWASQSSYPTADAHLGLLGVLMGTTTQNGTYGSGWQAGLSLADVHSGHGLIRFHQHGKRRHWNDIADFANAGAIVMPVVGWYPDLPITVRDGGHCFALSHMSRSFGSKQMGFRDPASDEGDVPGRLTMQSPFVTNMSAVWEKQVDLCCINTVIMDKVAGYSSDSTDALIDEYTAILPVSGLTTSPDEINFVFFRPWTFSWDSLAGISEFDFPLEFVGPVTDFDFAPNSPDFFVAGPGGVWQISPIDGDSEQLVAADEVTDIAFGRTPRLYVLSDGQLVTCYDITGDEPVEEGELVITHSEAIVYDDVTDRVIAFGVDPLQLLLLPRDLNGDPVVVEVPDVEVDGKVYMTVSPLDGRIWIASENLSKMYLIRPVVGAPAIVEAFDGIVSAGGPMQMTDEGHLLVREGGFIKEFKEAPGEWVPVDDGLFNGWQVGSRFAVMRSRSDFEPGVHDQPEEYRHVLPELAPAAAPDCLGDVNQDDVVNVIDLLAVLSAWGGTSVEADQGPPGGDGVINVVDLLVILANWGPCP